MNNTWETDKPLGVAATGDMQQATPCPHISLDGQGHLSYSCPKLRMLYVELEAIKHAYDKRCAELEAEKERFF